MRFSQDELALKIAAARQAISATATAQRVRAGLTGLAAIFLVVMVAAAGMRPERSVAPVGTPAEPLSVLGVTPGAAHPAARVRLPVARPAVPLR